MFVTTESCFISTREALLELTSTNWQGGSKEKGHKTQGEEVGAYIPVTKFNITKLGWKSYFLRPQKHVFHCGSAEQKRRDTIRLVKSMQLVQRTLGRFPGWAALQNFPSVGKINNWNGSVFFATANLYLGVIKMLSAKEIPCSLSQTWGHPFSL